MTIIITHSEEETFKKGLEFARQLNPPAVILFYGDLGTGKTVFIRGVCVGLGCGEKQVRSPSYTLINEYTGRCPVYHVDLYRLTNALDITSIGLDEVLETPGVVLVEWAERLENDIPESVRIHLKHLGMDSREIRIIQ